MKPKSIKNILPSEVAQLASSTDPQGFRAVYGNSPLLLVKLRDGDVELAQELSLTIPDALDDAGDSPRGREETVLVTDLDEHSSARLSTNRAGLDLTTSVSELRLQLIEQSHYVVPVRKRAQADGLFADHVSVGRARNKDIVLRDSSVSKFHGWFIADENGFMCFSDAGSTNHTHINRIKMEARQPVPLRPGDRLRFGSIEAILTTPEILWHALQAPARRAALP